MKNGSLLLMTAITALAFGPAHGQAIGSLGNFDCDNDTGETAEGFEIDVEDIQTSDLTREFPSNFSGQEYVQRFGVPAVTAYDNRPSGGHRGVKVTWAATWDPVNLKWVAKWGGSNAGYPAPGNGVAYVAKPPATQGDSCWLLGQGANYAASGCDHFGLSFTPSAVLGKVSYHWLTPNPAARGTLISHPWTGGPPLPAMPVQGYVPPAAGGHPVIHAVAEAPENPEPVWGQAYWVKTYTSQSKVPADLDKLQKNLIPLKGVKGTPVKITWALLQKPPAGVAGEKLEIDDDAMGAGKLALIRRYEYYLFTGYQDPESHEASCGADIGAPYPDCSVGPKSFTVPDPDTGAPRKFVEKGRFLGAHMNAYNIP